jgi:hypothetical protein
LVGAAFMVRRHYDATRRQLRRLDELVDAVQVDQPATTAAAPAFNPRAKTAVVMVNGFNGLGLHTLFGIIRMFPGVFKNFVFVQVGIVDAGNFKGADEVERLKHHVRDEGQRYVHYMQQQQFYAESVWTVGTDVVSEVTGHVPDILERFPNAIFFGGQLVFPHESWATRWLHNYAVFALQRAFYLKGLPFLILPIRV